GAAASRSTFDDVLRLGDGWYPLTSDDLPAEVAQLAEAARGGLPPVTAVEMDGQREGAPWSWENAAAAKKLAANALAYADCGVYCLSIGVPADDTERFNRALDHLASL